MSEQICPCVVCGEARLIQFSLAERYLVCRVSGVPEVAGEVR